MKAKRSPPTWAALILLLGCTPHVYAAAGRTPGSAYVSESGAFNYDIPIQVPPGPNGLQPRLSLHYNSENGNSILGVGWELTGLTSISRCSETIAQDGVVAGVTLGADDKLCLDKNRLRLTSGTGTYGESGSTYQTEVATFSDVILNGNVRSSSSYFIVKARDGLIYEYGNGRGSQVSATGTSIPVEWNLDKVTDRAGNTMVISYNTSNGTAVPAEISWTPTTWNGNTYAYTMQFSYGTNAPQSSTYGYVAGTPVSNTNLLSSISISYDGTTVKDYVLGYEPSPSTSRERLTQVQECADSTQTNCLAPSVMTYQNATPGVAEWQPINYLYSGINAQIIGAFDFNGDGRQDILFATSSGLWVIFGGTGGIPAAPVQIAGAYSPGVTDPAQELHVYYPMYAVGDVHGNGSDSILVDENGEVWEYDWDASSGTFDSTNLNVAMDPQDTFIALVDLNGDGLPDLVSGYYNPSGLVVYSNLNKTASGGTFSSTRTTAYVGTGCPVTNGNCFVRPIYREIDRPKPIDVNGDGIGDLLLWTWAETGYGYSNFGDDDFVLFGNSDGTFSLSAVHTDPLLNYHDPYAVQAFDLNDDNCTDIADSSGLYVSGCNGGNGGPTQTGTGQVLGAIDWDRSGRTDLIVTDGTNLEVEMSTGTGLGPALSTAPANYGGPLELVGSITSADLTGLGEQSLVGMLGGKLMLAFPIADRLPDLLTSVVDGYGVSESPTYGSIAWSNYTKGNKASYPEEDWDGVMSVVDQLTASDGIGGAYTRTYSYSGARVNLEGRGFEGFQSVTESDSRPGSQVVKGYFNTTFPLTGTMLERDVYQVDGKTLISSETYTDNATVLDDTTGNQRYFVRLDNRHVQSYEVGGIKNGAPSANTGTSYVYDGYGNVTSESTTVTDQDTSAPESPYATAQWTTTATTTYYPDDGSNWCLNQPTSLTVTKSAPSAAPITHYTTYVPDYVYCRETSATFEPSSPTYAVTDLYSYDDFGNVDGVKVTGTGMAARTAAMSWGDSGQLPVSITNALGQTTTIDYDFGLGVPTDTIDPNGITTSATYDAFGRMTSETSPDKTKAAWTYADCASLGECLIGTHGFVVTRTLYNADGTVQTDGTTYYDQLNRPLVTTARLLQSGSYSRADTRYDDLGRVQERSAPCLWSSMSTPCQYWTTYAYDALNRVTAVQRPVNASDSSLTGATFEHEGDTIVTTDPDGNESTETITPAGTLVRIQDAGGYAINYGYDSDDDLISANDSLKNDLYSASYASGAVPLLVATHDMDAGDSTYSYDALGELTAWTDPKGHQFFESYDALSRPLTRTDPDYFTQWTWGSSAAQHNIGKLQAICSGTYRNTQCDSGAYSETETYDSLGRLYQTTLGSFSEHYYTYTWTYSETAGLPDTLTYPISTSGQAVKLQYAYQNGYLESVTDVLDSPNTAMWQANAMNAAGQITQETLGNGIVTNRSYDAVTHWLASVQSGPNGTAAAQNESFLYDPAANVIQREENNLGLTENFYYDQDNRLTSSTLNGKQNLLVSYDGMGNITSRSDVAGGTPWTYDLVHKHQVTQAGTGGYRYAYDANGNETGRGSGYAFWWSFDKPSLIQDPSGEIENLTYTPDGRIWEQNDGDSLGAQYIHIGDLMEDAVTCCAVNDYRHYIYAGSEPVAMVSRKDNGTNAIYYLHTDGQGSVAGITDANGNYVVDESFTAFGARREWSTWSGTPTSAENWTIAGITKHGYTFQRALGSSQMGLNDMVGRVQDAVTGRFLSPDPVVPDPENTQSFNPYSYAMNNPTSRTDPTGFDDFGLGSDSSFVLDVNACPYGITVGPLQAVTVTGTPLTFEVGYFPSGLGNVQVLTGGTYVGGNIGNIKSNGSNVTIGAQELFTGEGGSAADALWAAESQESLDSFRTSEWQGERDLALAAEELQKMAPPAEGRSYRPHPLTLGGVVGGIAEDMTVRPIGDLMAWMLASKGWDGYATNPLTGDDVSPREMQDSVPKILLAAVPFVGQGGRPVAEAAQVLANRIAGNAFRDELAGLLEQAGRNVETEVYKRTPFGKRFIDIEVSRDGTVLGGVETKVGSSRYTPIQQLKDWWLTNIEGYPVNVARKP